VPKLKKGQCAIARGGCDKIQIDEQNGFAERILVVDGGRRRINSQIIGRQTFITVIGHQDGLFKLG
jgi:hypothetical protein